ncbi:MAG TPA: endonuclease/exonuclease/phosphatase family protein [Hellea balneolensis]|uniref:Endonuclease/exonuclease/phosphatase family protein n=1 Tax=Hellea balneolensis TaxID=287478 RepID=A0A7C5R3R7_9PROT|nr:endonuclease/exonuclease/phosphatase family protein [Hellea balneolensis]
MKIINWNCNGAFRKKFHLFSERNADVLVIQECENPKLAGGDYQNWAKNYLWTGKNKNKGIGVFSFLPTKIKPLDWNDDGLKLFLSCKITSKLNILGVWTQKANSFPYIGQLWKYLQIHKEGLSDNTFICGDFNSNTIWDKRDRWWNHSDVVRELEEMDYLSVYHTITREEQGKETSPTFYLYRKKERPYHIDYVFIPKVIFKDKVALEIGQPDKWLGYSDHMPIIFEL